jgi:triacylglycerol esterase/lipase EstA (alpha/beta hydrolase family)
MRLKVVLVVILISFFSGCASVDSVKDDRAREGENFQLKYPVVLVHGLVAHDKEDADDWGRIPDVLRGQGVDLYFGNTEGMGSYESNAAILKNRIDEILLKTNRDKVNIIGHSRGGLDARYLIWKYNFGDKVASVTMISTPHHGWEFADLFYEKSIARPGFGKSVLKRYSKLYKKEEQDIYDVIYHLTTKSMSTFNALVQSDENVFYQTYYSTMNNAFDDFRYVYTYPYLKKTSGRNDGIVSEKSVRWGTNCFEISGGISHTEIIDVKKRKISGVNIPLIYTNIIKELSAKGF